jgi:predicted enzyme related to lactoylglutathione lyase
MEAVMPNDTDRGRFVWYELLTSDPEAARGFYTELIGWGTTQWEGGDQPYTMWTKGEARVAGVMALPDDAVKAGVPPHWLAYIGTPDVDATLTEATKLGAKVLMPKMAIPKVGSFAVLADPQGAAFAVHTSEEAVVGDEGSTGVGHFSWHELATTDHEAAFDFYSTLFGWVKTEVMDMGPAGLYQMYGRGGSTLGGMYNKSADMPGPPSWLFYVTVDDVDATAPRVSDLGGQVVVEPMEVPGGDRIAQCRDPQGAAFAMHST